MACLIEIQFLNENIYYFSRKECEDVASELSRNGISAVPYHAGLGPSDRTNAQDRWIKDKVDVICATIAFGNYTFELLCYLVNIRKLSKICQITITV